MCLNMCFECVLWVVHLPWPLSLTNLAECNYSSICVSVGTASLLLLLPLNTENSQSTATMGV